MPNNSNQTALKADAHETIVAAETSRAADEAAAAKAQAEAKAKALQDAADLNETIKLTRNAVAEAEEKLKAVQDELAALLALVAPPPPVLVPNQLRELIAVVEAGNTDLHRTNLLHRLDAEQNALCSDDGERLSIVMAGITGSASTGPKDALANWCSAARRAIMGAEAA